MLITQSFTYRLVILCTILTTSGRKTKSHTKSSYNYVGRRNTRFYTKTMCLDMDMPLRARKMTCFLRPDTGPCRADILQWYYDVKMAKCFRFFWGGCQGNGNRFESRRECSSYCRFNISQVVTTLPHFCNLTFDYGTCFGHYNRWAWDKYAQSCKRRLYSGCGGNQNNFETQTECVKNCIIPPNNTLQKMGTLTTCIPFDVDE